MQSRRAFLATATVPLLRGQSDNTRMFADAEAYERFMGRWSRLVAPPLLTFADIRPGGQMLDVGSGTGVLAFAIAQRDRRRNGSSCRPPKARHKRRREGRSAESRCEAAAHSPSPDAGDQALRQRHILLVVLPEFLAHHPLLGSDAESDEESDRDAGEEARHVVGENERLAHRI
jgi:hypothetical protein